MTKGDIVERISEKIGFSKKEASEVVDSIFEVLKSRLADGGKVKISGFGNFVVNQKRPRKGRNPQTGDEITITGRRVLSFKASPVLKKAMNTGYAGPSENSGEPEDAGDSASES
jgi:integration host factor subunit alpha